MDAIGAGEAEVISLDAGLAYYAFLNKSMKALAKERLLGGYLYDAMAVVPAKLCDAWASKHKASPLSFADLRGLRSCHPGYRTAAGWNLPVEYLLTEKLAAPLDLAPELANDIEIVGRFFTEGSCAPGEEKGNRMCSACDAGGTCDELDAYAGMAGAFRCLVEEKGDVAFVRASTPQLFSQGGTFAQTWSSRPLSDFKYLCAHENLGCLDINPNYPPNCSLGQVASNAVMTRNAIPELEKLAIVDTLTFAGGHVTAWREAMYLHRNQDEHLLAGSAIGLDAVDELTRAYLGGSGVVAGAVQALDALEATASKASSRCATSNWRAGLTFTVLAVLLSVTFF
eukprot:SM000038S14376  [mRNA]  locus=s38:652514:654870:+ [translate_table: standard]